MGTQAKRAGLASRRQSVCFWLRREGIPADTGRPLRFDTPIVGRSRGFREFDSLGDGYKVRHGNEQMGGDAWARRIASQLAGDLWLRRTAPGCRSWVSQGLHHVRCGWLAYCAGRIDLARAMYAAAESDILRTGLAVLGSKAGEAWLAELSRRSAGRVAHGDGPARTRAEVMAAHQANPGASNYKIAQITGIPEATVRRHRPKAKTQPNRAP